MVTIIKISKYLTRVKEAARHISDLTWGSQNNPGISFWVQSPHEAKRGCLALAGGSGTYHELQIRCGIRLTLADRHWLTRKTHWLPELFAKTQFLDILGILAWIRAKLAPNYSKKHLQHDSRPFFPLAPRFKTFLLRHALGFSSF